MVRESGSDGEGVGVMVREWGGGEGEKMVSCKLQLL